MSTSQTANQSASNRNLARRFDPECAVPGKNYSQGEILTLTAKLHEGTEAELNALAALRGLSTTGIALASARGL